MKKLILAFCLCLFTITAFGASGLYNGAGADLANATLDWDTDTLKVALLDSNHTFTGTDDTWANISANEVSATGYTAGGATLASCSITDADPNVLDCADVTWTITGTLTAAHAAIYNTSDSDNLIVSYDFGGDSTTIDGDFEIKWHANGPISVSD